MTQTSNQPGAADPRLINQNHAGGGIEVLPILPNRTHRPAYERILNALESSGRRVRHVGQGKARSSCPGHDGDNPNALSIMDGETRVSLHCFAAGCDGAEILAGLGLTVADRYHAPQTTYTYDDGRKVTRTHGADGRKRFTQSGKTKGTPILYRLDRLARAETIYLAEGEEDVHALESAGVVATTAPMGADNFAKVDVTPLYGKKIIAVVDRDAAGEKWATAVREALDAHAELTLVQAQTGKDASDHLAAGRIVADFEPWEPHTPVPARRARLTRASDIEIRPVRWAWDDSGGRIPAGSLTITAGREGTGKSSFGVWLTAQITRGTLPGAYFGQPRPVFYVAVEDSRTYTLAPRLTAAGADLDLVFRFEVITETDDEVMLSLPKDTRLLEAEVVAQGAAMVVIDPLMSVIGESIDTHRTREVRLALDPLAKLADRTGSVIMGIAHFNKAAGTDAASLLSGSHAFRDVPRSIFGFARDDSDNSRVMTQVKNSLGRDDLPSLAYAIETAEITTPFGVAETGRFTFTGESSRTVADILRDARGEQDEDEKKEVAAWLADFLDDEGGEASAKEVFAKGSKEGYSRDALKRAKKAAGVRSEKTAFDTGWVWRHTEKSAKSAKGAGNETPPPSRSSVPPSADEAAEDSDTVLKLFLGTNICADCGEPYDQPGFTHRCRDRHLTERGATR